ncbi:MAG: DedA family protein [Candidatus Altiarchaeota archaeon]|nr:DedA family protein [Candidatus Altiarchaeota archaeon]
MTDPMTRFLKLPLEGKIIVFTVLFFILLGMGVLFERDTITGLINAYGLVGLFSVALIGSTVFLPFLVEGLFPFLLASGIDPFTIVGIATFGALLGTCINYFLGFVGSSIIEQKVDHGRIEQAKQLMNKYGGFGLFIVIAMPLPTIPVDPITVIPGITRMRFIEFALTVAAAKLVKYAFYAGIFEIINSLL